MKNLLLVKNQLKLASYILTSYLLLMITLTGLIEVYSFVTDPVKIGLISDVLVPRASAELPMKEWIKNEVETAGLDWDMVSKVLNCESSGNPEAQVIEPNMTISSGIWQINSIHKGTISPSERLNYKTSTKWSIDKIKRDGGMCAWSCARILGYCK